MKKGYPIFLLVWFLAAILAACSGPAGPGPSPTQPADLIPTFTPRPIASPGCDQGFSHLAVGQNAVVVEVGHPNRVRSSPNTTTNNVIGKIDPGKFAKIVDGPVCADGLVFWKVESNLIPSGSGWTAEGDGKVHWLEPYTP